MLKNCMLHLAYGWGVSKYIRYLSSLEPLLSCRSARTQKRPPMPSGTIVAVRPLFTVSWLNFPPKNMSWHIYSNNQLLYLHQSGGWEFDLLLFMNVYMMLYTPGICKAKCDQWLRWLRTRSWRHPNTQQLVAEFGCHGCCDMTNGAALGCKPPPPCTWLSCRLGIQEIDLDLTWEYKMVQACRNPDMT